MSQESDIPQNDMSSATHDQLKLLVVDDELDNLELLHRTFRRSYRVYRASSGQEALECLKQHGEMAIIISDQRMPKMNGTEFLSLTTDEYPDTIRIVLTGYTDVEDLVDAINSGQVFKYITKPWKPNELRQVIDQAANTYRIVKQRTHALSQSLKKEELYNSITTTIRSSLDYANTLQTVVKALGQAFDADYAVLYPVDAIQPGHPPQPVTYAKTDDSIIDALAQSGAPCQELVLDKFPHDNIALTRLAAKFTYRDTPLASIALYQIAGTWDSNTINLFNSIAEQVVMAISQAKLYNHVQRQTEQMQTELNVARQIQNKLLHQVWPDIPGIKIQAKCQAARAVGGDFYEVFIHPQGDIWLAVGDVSGKGVPAALFMASAISLLRRELSISQPPGPEKVMANLNQALNADLVNNEHMITMVLVQYNPTSKELVYANAGHIYPLVWSQKNVVQGAAIPPQPTYLREGNSVPLGILPRWRTEAGRLSLNEGDALLLASDGITEALVTIDGQQKMLNQAGLWQLLLEQTTGLDLKHLLVQLNTTDSEQHDDQTILSLEVAF
ncbi:SpoIIE family protein phosphatase [Leptothoe spongobia]|uniref:SpoIIE family protein phosphatase n=1 Tax=Leptothoe spongobia TAU-MAC 1115 TaxID=1967444 RepID=A0A947DHG8_9CYAN|nr:SpoIIE family protein phosphatase [Leptothoe spongobia]MBT9316424.1 SpoIIE family protein phosphatase [Leptothoe spongobia TAU-MAC 1115]